MENIEEWIEKIIDCGKAVIVEGPNDKKALARLGIDKVYILSKKPLFVIIENIVKDNDSVIILTDNDRKGRELYGKLFKGFQKFGVEVDNRFREFLLRRKISHIEGLDTYVKNHI